MGSALPYEEIRGELFLQRVVTLRPAGCVLGEGRVAHTLSGQNALATAEDENRQSVIPPVVEFTRAHPSSLSFRPGRPTPVAHSRPKRRKG